MKLLIQALSLTAVKRPLKLWMGAYISSKMMNVITYSRPNFGEVILVKRALMLVFLKQ